jgi:Phosphotransferase enzyme family
VEHDRGTSVIATAIGEWPSALEDVLLGTSNPARIVGLLDGFTRSALASELHSVTFYRRGVGAVFGLLLMDNRRVVVKVHRLDLVREGLDGIRTVQRTLAERGFPAPMPIGDPQTMGNGIGAAEEMLSGAEKVNPHDASVRRVLAAGLFQFVEAATPMRRIVQLPLANPFGLPDDQLWPTPHDLRFDLSLPGAEWIDELAKDARSVLDQSASEPMVIGHADWRIENLGIDRSTIVAIFDWDSVCTCPEAVLVAAASVHFTTDWSDSSTDPFPSPDESSAFVNEYEQARGRRFASRDRELVEAAQIYRLAYGARCEHSDSLLGLFPDADGESGFAALLRSMAT